MAVKLKPGAKVLLGVVAVGLIGFGVFKAKDTPMFKKIFPDKEKPGTVTKDLFPDGKEHGNKTSPGTTDSKTINVGIVTWGGYAGGIVANNGFDATENSIFYKKYGHKVKLIVIDDFAKSRATFATGGKNGGIDIMWSTVDAYALEYPQLAKQGLDPKVILQYDWSRGGDAIAVTKDIASIADLRGKKIAAAQATPSHYFGLWALAQGGVKNNEVDWVFTASAPEAANLFKAGKVDACVSWSPDVYMAAEAKGKILVSTKEATHLIADVFVARGDFIKERPEAVKAFVQGWFDGVEEAKKNPAKAIKLMAQNFTGIGPADAEGMWNDVYLPGYKDNYNFFGLNGEKTPSGYHKIFDSSSRIWKKIGESNTLGNAEESLDASFVQNLKTAYQSKPQQVEKIEFKPMTTAQKTKKAVVSKRVSVYFQTGSSTLDENAKFIIDYEVAPLASTFGSTYIRIAGNTDNTGNRQSNISLSKKRAQAVKDYLVSKYKFSSAKFAVTGNGPDKPVADNKTDKGRAKNRRTDFEVIPK